MNEFQAVEHRAGRADNGTTGAPPLPEVPKPASAFTPTTSPSAAAGLRERKKAKTRLAIQRQALALFETRGFAATTVEQIAEATEISASTLFRYFPTKEAVILDDSLDSLFLDCIRSQPPELRPFQAVRAAMSAVQADRSPEAAAARERNRIIHTMPDVRAAWLEHGLPHFIEEVAEAIAPRARLAPGDFGVRVFAGALAGAWLSVMYVWAFNRNLRMTDLLNEATRLLEDGLPFG
jgi:AcrR family transcriptional regulator